MRYFIRGLCVLLGAVTVQSHAQTWTGNGSDTLWSNPDNWSTGVMPTNNGTATITIASLTPQTITLDADWLVANVQFNNTAAAHTFDGINASTLTIRSVNARAPTGAHVFNVDLALNPSNWDRVQVGPGQAMTFLGNIQTNGQDLRIDLGGQKHFYGNIFGTGGIQTTTSSDHANFYASNLFSGDVQIARWGSFNLLGDSGGFLETQRIQISHRGHLQAGDGTSLSENPDRIHDDAELFLRSGRFTLHGSNHNTTTREVISLLSLEAGTSILTLSRPNASTQVELVTQQALQREAGAFLLLGGPNLGETGPGATRLFFGASPSLLGGGGAADSTQLSISPHIFYAHALSYGLTTYDSQGGVRHLNTATEYRSDFQGTLDDNVRMTASASLSANASANSLFINDNNSVAGTNLNIGPGNTLSLQSGVVLMNEHANIHGGTLAFGNTTGVIALSSNSGVSARGLKEISSVITGTAGLEAVGLGLYTSGNSFQLKLSGINAYTGDTYLGIYTTINNANALGADGGLVYLHRDGAVAFDGSISLTKSIVVNELTEAISPGLGNASLAVLQNSDVTLSGDLLLNHQSFGTQAMLGIASGASLAVTGKVASLSENEGLYVFVDDSASALFINGLSTTQPLRRLRGAGPGSMVIQGGGLDSTEFNCIPINPAVRGGFSGRPTQFEFW